MESSWISSPSMSLPFTLHIAKRATFPHRCIHYGHVVWFCINNWRVFICYVASSLSPDESGIIWSGVMLTPFAMDTTPRGRNLKRHQARSRTAFLFELPLHWFLCFGCKRFSLLCSIAVCVVVEQLYVDCSWNITLAIDKDIIREGDDDDSEQKINIGSTFQVALPNWLNMRCFVMNGYFAKRNEKQIVRFAKTTVATA